MADQLSDKQRKALAYIRTEVQTRGRPPTLREIGAQIGVTSTNGVRYLLDTLQKKGYLSRSPMLSRAIELTDRTTSLFPLDTVREVPLIGRVAAGTPLLATENLEGHVRVDRSIAGSDETFALRVRGDSMIDAGILEGDVIFAKPQETANPGDIVVALLGDEATVKYFRPQKDRVCLEPANRYYSPIVVERGTPGFRILGRVIGLMRKIQ
ncbi:transcriptional repressor LexA [bacterium]|nr:transcriptional repressor LexA [bacterium]MBU1985235.1 transcriptional repressor LexA [bacterium]